MKKDHMFTMKNTKIAPVNMRLIEHNRTPKSKRYFFKIVVTLSFKFNYTIDDRSDLATLLFRLAIQI